MEPEIKSCQSCHKDFTIETEDFNYYEKIKVPAPTWCPECRMIRRFNFRNESNLFRRLDAHTGEEVFSSFSNKSDLITYENTYWFGDGWDRMSSGREYDFSRSFFEQFDELFRTAPLPARSFLNMVNSDYCNEISYGKNCYLCFNADYLENCAYARKINHAKDSLDLYEGAEDELCYEDVMVDKSYRTLFSVDCESCVDVWFSKGLRGCTNCFGCVNLVNKSYCLFNEQLSKEEYVKKLKEFSSGSYEAVSSMQKKAKEFWLKFPVKYARNVRVVNSTGERVFDSKNVKESYSVRGGENLRFCQDIQSNSSNSYDYSVWGDGAENIYEGMVVGFGASNVKFCFNVWNQVRDMEYCAYCFSSNNCFGCVGLYKKEYCIFNKQYSKDEYPILVEKIKQQMKEIPYVDKNGRKYFYGEFFPQEISPLSYNESHAQYFFPLDEAIANSKGLVWREINKREYQPTIKSAHLSDNISDVGESITKEAIECTDCKRAFRITNMELQFYKRIVLPLPRACSECRFIKRFKFVNPPALWERGCMCDKEGHFHEGSCNATFKTPYSPNRPEIVYCEKCYQAEFV